ncbi:MAG: hypothetical protein F6J96_27950 [Symploca sp. SIO1C2]|nr:hypothetical protein [Symploca sp. SIO1C2]
MKYPTTKSCAIAIMLVGLLCRYFIPRYAIAFTVGAYCIRPFQSHTPSTSGNLWKADKTEAIAS